MNICLNDKIFETLSSVVTSENVQAYVIGGWVRDCLLKRDHPEKDIDIVVIGSGIDIAKKAARKIHPGTKVSVFKNFGTAMFRNREYEIEFVGARKESYDRNSRKPVVEDGTLEDDQKRRDFTINTLAISLNKETFGEFLDPFDGIEDLKKKIRHTYDLHQLLRQKEFVKFFNSPDFDKMLLKVAQDDVASYRNNNKWLSNHPKDALIFSQLEKVWKELEPVYNGDFKKLVYGDLPNQESVLGTCVMIRKRLSEVTWSINTEVKE